MKKTLLLFCITLSIGVISSCKKKQQTTDTTGLGPNFPVVINTIVTPAILDTLTKHGTIVYNGLNPPTVNGIYLFSPDLCLYDNSSSKAAGTLFTDYKFKFSNQNTAQYTINVDLKAVNSNVVDAASANSSTFLSGNGNFFSVFSQTTGVLSGISYKSLDVYSGEMLSGNIKNFQHTIYLVSKGADPNNLLAIAGTIRVFADKDATSESQTTFDVSPLKVQSLPEGSKALPFALSAN